jgi:GDP-4-dehydro-6-deoxy-D-mannose reductase
MRILITGITGFVGGHLVESLVAAGGHSLSGVSRDSKWPAPLAHLSGQAELHPADLFDARHIETILHQLQPEWIMHLAGYANTGGSFKDPSACWHDNLDATRSLYEAIGRTGLRPRILFVSTGLIYGDPDEPGRPCDERTTLKPASPYAASKAAADLLSYQCTRHPGLDIVRVRLFNQIGPRQSPDYAVANFARQIAAIEAGKQPPRIETGDLSAQRDLTDVRDTVAAFPLLLAKGATGEAYNAGRGDTFSMQTILDELLKLSTVKVEVIQKADRKADTAVTRAGAEKLKSATGWLPRIPLQKTLRDILDYWRSIK